MLFPMMEQASNSGVEGTSGTAAESQLLASSNPAAVKRTVLASFTDLMLLPVTIVPRTVNTVGSAVGAMVTTGGNAAVQGIAMLNPGRWVGGAAVSSTNEGYGGTSVVLKEKDTVVFKALDHDIDDEDDFTGGYRGVASYRISYSLQSTSCYGLVLL
jgi:recyclin-1